MKRLLLTLLWMVTAALPLVTQAQEYARMPITPFPPWAPPGYARAQYYYLPDLQVYYDVPAAKFLLLHRGHWIALAQLPPRYRSYDLNAAPKVVLNYYGPYPYRYYEVHRQRFPRWYCPPHSVIVYRDAPAHAKPARGDHSSRRYRQRDSYRYDSRNDDYCNGQCTHEHHNYGPREDRRYAPDRVDGEPEREYEYYNREENDEASPQGRWR